MPPVVNARKVVADFRRTARKLYVSSRTMRRIVEPPGWRRSFHPEIDDFLTKRGFGFLGDFCLTRARNATEASEARQCVALSADHTIVALGSTLQLLPARFWLQPMLRWPTRSLQLLTEFIDGDFLFTTNDESTFLLALPRTVRRVELPANASMARILRGHRLALAAELKRGRRPRTMPDEAAMTASIRRYHRAECVFRRRVNFLRPGEARALVRLQHELATVATILKGRHDRGPLERGEIPAPGRQK